MVRFRVGLGLGLGFNVDIQNGTIMSINEEPSPNSHRSTSGQVDNSVLAVQINDIFRCTAAYPLET